VVRRAFVARNVIDVGTTNKNLELAGDGKFGEKRVVGQSWAEHVRAAIAAGSKQSE